MSVEILSKKRAAEVAANRSQVVFMPTGAADGGVIGVIALVGPNGQLSRPDGWAGDADGDMFDLSSAAMTYTHNADGQIATETATIGAASWVRQYTYTDGLLTGIGLWEAQ